MKTLLTLMACLLIGSPLAAASGVDRQWSFRVLLDGKDVGEHHFVVTDEEGRTRLETRADFRVKFLFATLYRYSHQNVETWENGCLAEIQSTTDANGDSFAVNGRMRNGFFEVKGKTSMQLPECVASFAYWNPAFLENERLLNSQDGEYLDVVVSEPVPDVRLVRGREVPAMKYHLAAGELDLLLWYSTNNEWLALESRTAGDRVLSYELL